MDRSGVKKTMTQVLPAGGETEVRTRGVGTREGQIRRGGWKLATFAADQDVGLRCQEMEGGVGGVGGWVGWGVGGGGGWVGVCWGLFVVLFVGGGGGGWWGVGGGVVGGVCFLLGWWVSLRCRVKVIGF